MNQLQITNTKLAKNGNGNPLAGIAAVPCCSGWQ